MSIVDRHRFHMAAKFGLFVDEDHSKLPTLYWLPKLHKRPYKSRFIANSSACTTTELSSLLTSFFFYERAEKHKSKERTILSFKRALFPGYDQSGNNEIGKWLKHPFGLHFLFPSYVEDSFCEDVHNVCPVGRSPDHRYSNYADYLFENYVTSHSKFPPEMWA